LNRFFFFLKCTLFFNTFKQNKRSFMTPIFQRFHTLSSIRSLVILSGFFMMSTGCNKKDPAPTPTPDVASYRQVNLVADNNNFGSTKTDPKLLNAWGIAIAPNGAFWISGNHSGSSLIYDTSGAQLLPPVNIPVGTNINGASPTGVVFNNTPDFVIPGKGPGLFIYSTEDGILSAWNGNTGTSTATVASRDSVGAVYKGLTTANDGGANFIYATDFHNARIDVFDKNFALVTTKPFNDPEIPGGFAPFNIQNIAGQLYVTYAKQLAPDNEDDQAGAGNGYVDVYTPAGTLVKRFATQGALNSPWGITSASATFGLLANAILIGNFGDGHISIYDENGGYQGQLMTNNTPISIDGLWAITFNNDFPDGATKLYFTAGPAGEAHGLFGYLKKM
jgi:uncharacterized protein (TIGR03118 family)